MIYRITLDRQVGGARFWMAYIRRPLASNIPMGVGAGTSREEAIRSAVAEVRARRARGEFSLAKCRGCGMRPRSLSEAKRLEREICSGCERDSQSTACDSGWGDSPHPRDESEV